MLDLLPAAVWGAPPAKGRGFSKRVWHFIGVWGLCCVSAPPALSGSWGEGRSHLTLFPPLTLPRLSPQDCFWGAGGGGLEEEGAGCPPNCLQWGGAVPPLFPVIYCLLSDPH